VDRYLLNRTFEELTVGDRQVTRGRTITEGDIVNWCALTGDWFVLHTDRVVAEQSPFRQRIAPGLMILAYATGLGVPADSPNIIANYGSERVRYPRPTLIGDTIHLEIEVTEKKERDAGSGVVTLRWDVLNQNGETVCASSLQVLVARERKRS
jgi:acyl dehydratase